MSNAGQVTPKRRRTFWLLFVVAILLVAGGVSYLASSSPDGLDSATLKGCNVVETDAGEQLTGDCIARHAKSHAMSESPLADYSIGGRKWTGGAAGIIGVIVVLAIAGVAFWLISRSRTRAAGTSKRDAGPVKET
jgi:cobalt/nickel transport protein